MRGATKQNFGKLVSVTAAVKCWNGLGRVRGSRPRYLSRRYLDRGRNIVKLTAMTHRKCYIRHMPVTPYPYPPYYVSFYPYFMAG